jgi:ABC-2 type transport system permease protein
MTARNSRAVWAIVRRDLTMLVASRATLIPMVLLPLVVFAALPLLATLAPGAINLPVGDLDRLTAALPAGIEAALPADADGRLTVVLLAYLLAPIVLLVPVTLAVIGAAGAIAGERERRTLETLLLSPVPDRDLFLAKTIAAWLPAVALTVVGSTIYQVIATVALADLGVRVFPNLLWTLLVLWVAPALAAAALAAVVLVSARARTLQDAMQVGAVLILPLLAIAVGQATGTLALGVVTVAATGAALWLVAVVLLRTGARTVQRDRLAAQR